MRIKKPQGQSFIGNVSISNSIMTFSERLRRSAFIGKNLSRFKMGMAYYTLLMSTITAAMTFKESYYSVDLTIIILAIPVLLILTVVLGYILDIMNINTQDQRKSNEMAHRFLMKSDIKTQEFEILKMKVLLDALQSVKDGKDVNFSQLEENYKEYQKKWKSPDSV